MADRAAIHVHEVRPRVAPHAARGTGLGRLGHLAPRARLEPQVGRRSFHVQRVSRHPARARGFPGDIGLVDESGELTVRAFERQRTRARFRRNRARDSANVRAPSCRVSHSSRNKIAVRERLREEGDAAQGEGREKEGSSRSRSYANDYGSARDFRHGRTRDAGCRDARGRAARTVAAPCRSPWRSRDARSSRRLRDDLRRKSVSRPPSTRGPAR
jgi:hypothetical protein